MELAKCRNGHFFDADKYENCPYCEIDSGKEDHTVGYDVIAQEKDRTIGKAFSVFGNLVVGWLVCVEGPERGRDYRLHAGRNFVGYSLRSDVVTEDIEIAAEKHFSVIYDEKKNQFSIASGEGTLTWLNGNLLVGVKPLTEDAYICAGKSKFAFRSFCREEVKWDENM